MKNLTFSKVSLSMAALALLAVFSFAGCGSGGSSGSSSPATSTTETTNSVPQIISVPGSYAKENVAYTYQVSAIDANNDTLTYSLTTAPSGMTINASTGLISWTPTSSQGGQQSAVVSVSDSKDSITQTYNVQVETATVAATQSISASTGGTVAVTDPTSPIYGAKISIPAGTLTSDAVVSITQHANASYVPEGAIVVGFTVSGQSASAGKSLRTKNKARASESAQTAYQIDVPYSQSFIDTYGLIESVDQLELFVWSTTQNAWEKATDATITAVDATANFVIAGVNGATEETEYLYIVVNTALRNLKQSNTLSKVEKGTANDFWNNAGKNLLILHGIGASEESFALPDYPNDFIEYFKADDYYTNILFYNYPSGEYIEGNASWLAAEILRNNKNVKFDVIAHSMGGLVARWLNEQWILKYPTNFSNNIERLVMVGTPNFGSSAATLADFALVSLSIGKLKVPSVDELETGSVFLKTINSGNSVQKGSALYYWYTGNDGDSHLDGCAESDSYVCVPTADNISFLGLDSTTAKTFGPTNIYTPYIGQQYDHSSLHEKCATNGICDEIKNAVTAISSTSQYTLAVSKSGTGSGTVTSSTGGISCGSTCSDSYNSGASVTLTASASSGSTFAGWSGGGCSGTGSCTMTMNAATTVTATFTATSAATPPTAPSGLVALTASTFMSLAWNDNSSDETGFKVERKTGVSGSWSQIASVGQNIAAYLDYGVSAGITYYYRVFAYNSSGVSGYSNEAFATILGIDTTPPTVSSTSPANKATGVAVNTAITATFSETMTASTVSAATFTLNNGVTGVVTYTGTTATFTPSSNLAYSTTYIATITTGAKDAAGNAMAAAYTWTFTTASAPGSAPSAPINVSAIAGDGQVSISWDAVSGATSYNLYWSTTSGVTKTNGTKIASVTSPYTHTGRTNSSIYYYVVTAVNSYGESSESSQVSATPQAPGSAPFAPSGVSATPGDGQAAISWSSVSGAISYNLYWSTTSGVSKTNGTKISNATSPYTHTGRTNGTIYYYVVTAVNSYGESVESSQVSATPSATPVPGANFKMPDTGQTTSYTNTFGEDHDYTINPPSYTDNGNGTVTDNVTGLVWQKQNDATLRTWADAGTYCTNLSLAGTGWRLPSRIELISIIDYGVYVPSINATFFPGTLSSGGYWSSTTVAFSTSAAWGVYFSYGQTYGCGGCSGYVRCVRGGQ